MIGIHTSIQDGQVAKKPEWGAVTTGSTTPTDVIGTLGVMFSLDAARGATISMEFNYDAIAGVETGLIIVEKNIGSAYVRIRQYTYDSTGLLAIDGYAAGTNAIRGVSYATTANETTLLRIRNSQTGGVARAISWTYIISQGIA